MPSKSSCRALIARESCEMHALEIFSKNQRGHFKDKRAGQLPIFKNAMLKEATQPSETPQRECKRMNTNLPFTFFQQMNSIYT